MASLRFLSSLFALIAVVAFVADVTPALNTDAPFISHSVMSYWSELAPVSLAATQTNIVAMTQPWVWDPVLVSILNFPMSLLFAGLAVVCGYFGRRREELRIHIN